MTTVSSSDSPSASTPAVTVVAQQVAVAYGVTLTAEAANSLYNDIYRIQRDYIPRGDSLHVQFPALGAIYDGLYHAGCDGSA